MIRFITFEGGDGCGKTTQIRAAENYLRERDRACVATREPGGTKLGQSIRKVLLEVGDEAIAPPTELFLYLADRAQHVEQVILPAIRAGSIVLCDRFTDSTLAYQGYGRRFEVDRLRRLNDVATSGVHPDLTILLDCPAAVGLLRTARRLEQTPATGPAEDRFEREEIAFHDRVRSGFLELAHAEPDRFRIVDAARGIEEVSRAVREIIDRELV
jgi:dTMP kinase